MAEITVILPCYNAGAFLPAALASLEAQTFRDFSIIIVDDGSNDPHTLAVLDDLPAGIRLVRQANQGLAAARNTGFREARSPLVLPLDCDDTLAPEFLAKTRAALAEGEFTFAFAWLDLQGEKSGVLAKNFNLFEQLFLNQLPYCLLLPRAAWQEVGGYDEAMRKGYEDWDFNIRLGLTGWRGIAVPEPLFRYRVSSSGMLQSVSASRHAPLWAYIMAKHSDVYSIRGLVRIWLDWRKKPSTHLAVLYFVLWAMARLLPTRIFNGIFRRLRRFSHSARPTI